MIVRWDKKQKTKLKNKRQSATIVPQLSTNFFFISRSWQELFTKLKTYQLSYSIYKAETILITFLFQGNASFHFPTCVHWLL